MQTPYLSNETILPYLARAIVGLQPVMSLMPHAAVQNEHILAIAVIKHLLMAPLVNWRLNRPPDPVRCQTLSQYIARTGRTFDMPIVLAFQHHRGQFDILDGVHRWRALQLLAEAQPAHPLLDAPILLNIRTNASEGELIEAFQNINKSIPVPDLYLRDEAKDRRECIERLAVTWQARYPSHFRSTKAPLRPNTNRDLFIEFLDHAYTAWGITFETKDRLEARIEEMNAALRQMADTLPDKIRAICEITGCYLFTKKLSELERGLVPV